MHRIVNLADFPEHVPTVAGWVYGEWGHLTPGLTETRQGEIVRAQLHHDRVPLTLLALDGASPAGTAALIAHDMTGRPELTPWLAAVYVSPEHRRRGIGAALVSAIEREAARLAVSTLSLFTPDQESFYARLGWTTREWTDYRGERVVIMQKTLAPRESITST